MPLAGQAVSIPVATGMGENAIARTTFPPSQTKGAHTVTSAGGIGQTAEADRRCWHQFISRLGITLCVMLIIVGILWCLALESSLDPVTHMIIPNSFRYFVLCFIGGGIASLPHTLMTPVDLLKCRIQVGEYTHFMEGWHRLWRIESQGSVSRFLPQVYRGWLPTLIGYGMQGSIKFCLYELLKYVLLARPLLHAAATMQTEAVPQLNGTDKHSGHTLTHYMCMILFSSCIAEVLADVALAPWETVKVLVQTNSSYSPFLHVVMPQVWVQEGLWGFYTCLIPLWCRQVPHTMMKFASFEKIVQLLYRALGAMSITSSGKAVHLSVTLTGGVLAGVLCALVSHPADTIVSKLSQRSSSRREDEGQKGQVDGASMCDAPTEMQGLRKYDCNGSLPKSLLRSAKARVMAHYAPSSNFSFALVRQIGWVGIWSGLVPRLAFVSGLTALQWLFYDTFKVAVGLPTTGGAFLRHDQR